MDDSMDRYEMAMDYLKDRADEDAAHTEYVEGLVDKLDAANARIAELEAALTDALYAWGLFEIFIESELSSSTQKIYEEAEERIQRARLALPK